MSKSPDAFRTISEVAEWLGVQAHVLRFWESKFTQVKPVKRAGGRRYYRPNDMLLIGGIKKLLHDDGLTIKGAQKTLREQGMSYVAGLSKPLEDEVEIETNVPETPEEESTVLPFAAPADIAPEPEAPPTELLEESEPDALVAEPAAAENALPSFIRTAAAAPTPKAAAPVPRNIDVGPLPNEIAMPQGLAPIGTALRLKRINPANHAKIHALLEDLAQLRDQMAPQQNELPKD